MADIFSYCKDTKRGAYSGTRTRDFCICRAPGPSAAARLLPHPPPASTEEAAIRKGTLKRVPSLSITCHTKRGSDPKASPPLELLF